MKGHLECHVYCPSCEYYIGHGSVNGQCVVCKTTWDRESCLKNGNFFLYLPIQTQLDSLLQREDITECLSTDLKEMSRPCIYEDIYSGAMYQNFCKEVHLTKDMGVL